jgi:hypothetical protein
LIREFGVVLAPIDAVIAVAASREEEKGEGPRGAGETIGLVDEAVGDGVGP